MLYTNNESKSFEEMYNQILDKQIKYDKTKKEFTQYDRLKVVYINYRKTTSIY